MSESVLFLIAPSRLERFLTGPGHPGNLIMDLCCPIIS